MEDRRAMDRRTVNFAPRAWQIEVLRQLPKYKRTMLLAHRSAGKTAVLTGYLGMTALTMQTPSPVEFAWTGISYKQVKRTAYQEFKKIFMNAIGRDCFYDSDIRVELPNGNRIHYLGLDNPEMLRGLHLHGMVTDELQEFKREDISTTLFPMLNAHKGFWVGSGTAKGYFNALADYVHVAETNPSWLNLKFTPDDTGLIDAEQWELIRATNSETEIQQEYYCSLEASLEGRVYQPFARSTHVKPVQDRGQDIFCGADFNVGKMTWVLAQHNENRTGLEVFGEMTQYDTDTAQMAHALARAYPNRTIYMCPDAAGNQRKSSATSTDISLLRQAGLKVLVPGRNPPISDRINAVNQLLKNPSGDIRLIVDPKCEDLIRTLSAHCYNVHTGQPTKDSGKHSFDAAGDSLGYLINMTFPIKRHSFQQVEMVV